MSQFLQYVKTGPLAGRIVSVIEHDFQLESLDRVAAETDVSHYVAWTEVDANGRPVDPVVTPRELLTADVVPGTAGEAAATVTIHTDRPQLRVRINGVEAEYSAEEVDGQTAVAFAFESPVPKQWRVEVDELERYLPQLWVGVS